MKVYSLDKLPDYEVSGTELRIHWGAEEVIKNNMNEDIIHWVQNEALCNSTDNRGQIISKIINSIYDTGAELSAINDGGVKYENYQTFRLLAKSLADGWFAK